MPSPRLRSHRLGALGHPAFRIFYIGYVVSLLGVWMQRTAQAWLVVELTGSPFYVGLVDALGTLPVLLFSLFAGALADRVSRYRMVFVTQTLAMLLGFGFAAVVYADAVTLPWILALATAIGVVSAFDIPARHAFFFDIVGKDDLPNAIALNSSAFNGTRAVGPSIAGILIGAFGVGICFLINGLSFLAVLAAMLVIRKAVDRRVKRTEGSAWRRIGEGLRYVAGEPRIRRILGNIAATSILALPVLALLPVLARNVLGLGAREFGWMMSAFGVGALGGALWLVFSARRIAKGRVLALTSVSFGLLVAVLSLVESLPLVLLILGGMGAAMIVTSALTNTLVQTIAPDHFRARVVSVYTVAFVGMAPIGSFLAGVVAERAGVAVTLQVGGIVTAVVAWMILGRSPGVMSV